MRFRTPPGVVAGSMLVGGLLAARLRDHRRLLARADDDLRTLRAAMTREQVLNDLGTGLLTATDSAGVHRLAAAAAAALVTECPGARTAIVHISPDHPENWTVLHAAGAGAEVVPGVRLPGDSVPAALLARLANGETVSGPSLSALGRHPVMLLPLRDERRFFGAIAVGTPAGPPAGVRKSLETLRTQVSLALSGVALTEELTERAMHDVLTGLGNRALLWDRMTGSLARARRSGRTVGVLLLDLNGFKPVNDTYGHDAGDLVLRTVAARLQTCVRTEDMVARLGGDEFVILAEDLTELAGALVIADRVVHALNEPIDVDGHGLLTPAAIGIALSRPGEGPDEVLRDADTAMYVAKRRGGGCYHVHS
jgi:diguanylate cyclase (GGDEF)-like protein